MKLIFKTNDKKVIGFDLDVENRKIEKIEIYDNQEKMASNYFPPKQNQTYARLEKLLEYYLDAEDLNLNMEDYIKYMVENDFYTPYAENLRVEVQKAKKG
jgi:hypothetical protein